MDKKRDILIIEDNPVTRKMMRLAFESEGYTVMEAGNGQEALRFAQVEQPNMIIQDLLLPDMDGFHLVKQLRNSLTGFYVPIVCFSGLVGVDEQRRILEAGFDDFILKPATPAELLKVVRTHIERRRFAHSDALNGRAVLLLIDNPVAGDEYVFQLGQMGANAGYATSGSDVLERAHSGPVDALLIKLTNKPENEDAAFYEALSSIQHLAGMPIVILSPQSAADEERAFSREFGGKLNITHKANFQQAIAALLDNFANETDIDVNRRQQFRGIHPNFPKQVSQSPVNARVRALEAPALYSILARFLEQITQTQLRGSELVTKLDEVLTHYLDACGYPSGVLYFLETDGRLVPHSHSGIQNHKLGAWKNFFFQPALLNQVMESKEFTVWMAHDNLVKDVLDAAGAESMVLCPLQEIDHRPTGILVLCSKRRQLSSDWLALAKAMLGPINQTIAAARTLVALAASEQRFRGIAESLADCIITTDENGIVVYANKAVEHIFGFTLKVIKGVDSRLMFPLLLPCPGVWTGMLTHHDGHSIPVKGSTSMAPDPAYPDRKTYTHVIHDLTVQEQIDELRYLANHDSLTNLANRRCFEDALTTYLSVNDSDPSYGAVLLLDLDYLKLVNDRFGHAAGDLALVNFAEVLQGAVRQTDLLARLGGDEFAIIVPYAGEAQALALASKLFDRLAAQPLLIGSERIGLSTSVGIVLYTSLSSFTVSELLVHADRGLYQAKQEGRGRARVYKINERSDRISSDQFSAG